MRECKLCGEVLIDQLAYYCEDCIKEINEPYEYE